MRIAEQAANEVRPVASERTSDKDGKSATFKDVMDRGSRPDPRSGKRVRVARPEPGSPSGESRLAPPEIGVDPACEFEVRCRGRGEVLTARAGADGRDDRRQGDGLGRGPSRDHSRDDERGADSVLDPLARSLAEFAPAATPTSASDSAQSAHAAFLGHVERLLKRVSIGGDRQKGTARIEVGSGELSGAVIVVHAEAGEVVVDIELPPGAHASEADWRARLERRFSERGVEVRELNLR